MNFFSGVALDITFVQEFFSYIVILAFFNIIFSYIRGCR